MHELKSRLKTQKNKILSQLMLHLDQINHENLNKKHSLGSLTYELQDEFVVGKLFQFECSKLRNINYAIERIEAGEFGNCSICGEPIPLKRLEALVTATECIDCAN